MASRLPVQKAPEISAIRSRGVLRPGDSCFLPRLKSWVRIPFPARLIVGSDAEGTIHRSYGAKPRSTNATVKRAKRMSSLPWTQTMSAPPSVLRARHWAMRDATHRTTIRAICLPYLEQPPRFGYARHPLRFRRAAESRSKHVRNRDCASSRRRSHRCPGHRWFAGPRQMRAGHRCRS